MNETKEIIGNAFRALTKSKNPDKITVIDICRRANVSRETFYYHFADKYDLFKWVYKNNLAERIRSNFSEGRWTDVIEKSINDAIESRIMFEKVLGNASIEYSEIMFETLYEFYYEELSKGSPDGRLSQQTEAEMYVYLKGGIEYYKYCLEKNTDMSYKTISKLIAGAMPDTLAKLFNIHG